MLERPQKCGDRKLGGFNLQKYLASLFGVLSRTGKSVDVDHLTRLVRRYSVEQQHVPRNLLDLVSLRYLESLPTLPPGQKLVLDRERVEVRLE